MSRKRLAADIVILSTGKVLSTGLRVGLIPIISRIYLPEQWGIAALFVSLVGIVVPIGILSFPQAVVLPDHEQEAAGLAFLSFCTTLGFSLLLWAGLGLCDYFSISVYPQLDVWIWLLPLGVVLQGWIQGCEGWLTRKRGFVLSSMGDVIQTGVTSGMRVGVGYLSGPLMWPLIFSVLAGQGLRLLAYGHHVIAIIRAAMTLGGAGLRDLLSRYRRFPLYNMPGALLFAFNAQVPLLALSYLFSPYETGQYAMVNGILVMALMLLGESVRRGYLHHATESHRNGQALRKPYLMMTGLLWLAAVGPVLLVLFYGQELFTFILGEKWAQAGVYAAALMPWLLMQWTAVPASALVITLRRQRFWFYFQQSLLIAQLGGMALGYLLLGKDALSLLWGYSLARSVMLMGLILYIALISSGTAIRTRPRAEEVGI